MESISVMIDRVRRAVKDSSFGDDFIFDLINDAIYETAMLVRPPGLIVYDAEVDFSIGQNIVATPADFFGPSLMIAKIKSTGQNLSVTSRVTEFDVMYSRRAASIHTACVKGNSILINAAPSNALTLLITYLKKPTVYADLTDDGSAIDFFIPRVGENAVTAYAIREIFNHIEDGIEGDKRNTLNYDALFSRNISKMVAHYGIENNEAMPSFIVHGGLGGDTPQAPQGRRTIVRE